MQSTGMLYAFKRTWIYSVLIASRQRLWECFIAGKKKPKKATHTPNMYLEKFPLIAGDAYVWIKYWKK